MDRYDQGVNEVADPAQLAAGETTACSGFWLKSGDNRAHLINPSSAFSAAASSVQDLSILPFDDGPDALVARANDALYAEDVTDASPALATSNISPALTALSGDRAVAAHYNDKWYLALGSEQRGQVLESSGSLPLTSREWGLRAPVEALTATLGAGSAGTKHRPASTDASTGWLNPANAYDADAETFASATLEKGDAVETVTLDLGSTWAADTAGVDRKLNVSWAIETEDRNTEVDVQFYMKDEANGDTWVNFAGTAWTEPPLEGDLWSQVDWNDDGEELNGNAEFRCVFTISSGRATVKIYDVYILAGGAVDNFTLNGALLYAVSEYNSATDEDGPRGPTYTVTTTAFATKNSVVLTLPDPEINSAATHYKVWRTAEGGTANTLGLLATVLVSETTFADDFSRYASTVQPTVAYPQIQVGTTYYNRDDPPPALNYVWHHSGALYGVDATNIRGIRSCVKGRPGSWPEIYYTPAIPQESHDTLLGGASLGFASVVATSGGMLRLLDVDRLRAGQLVEGRVDRIAGAPGCVGYRAFCVVPWKGISTLAWVSPNHGVCATDGNRWHPISDSIDWSKFSGQVKSGFVLEWDEHRRCLILAYDTAGGQNDSYYLGHVERPKGPGIVWTGPHSDAYVHRMAAANGSAGTFYLFGANDDTVKRLDDPDGTDSVSYSLTTGKRYGPDRRAWAALDGRLLHTDLGTGTTASLAYTVSRNPSGRSHTKTVTVATAGDRADQFDVSRSGEYHQYTLSGSATVRGAISGIDWTGSVMSREGKVGAA